MTSLDNLCTSLAQIAPLKLAESWDNVGLLVGDRQATIERAITCLTITPSVVAEAIAERAGLVVTHHPLPFKPLSRITCDSITGRMLWRLIGNGTAIYSAHTAFDSAADGINAQWSRALQLESVQPLLPLELDSGRQTGANGTSDSNETEVSSDDRSVAVLGAGRYGRLREPMALADLVDQCSRSVGARHARLVGDQAQSVTRIGFACGSGGSFLAAAKRCGCDALITGEATFHACLDAESSGIGLGLLGHYWSERFAMEQLARQLSDLHPELTVWPSRCESDPIRAVEA